MKVILIRHIPRYDDCEEIVDIAIDGDIANKRIEELKIQYPYVYGDEYGRFVLEEYRVIDT